jgi:exodeoxyribonuclease VII small subunit
VALYKEGLALARECSRRLQAAKNEVTQVGRELLTVFEPDETAGEEQ